MHLALGDEIRCVNDVAVSCNLDIETVLKHIHGLLEEVKKTILLWIGKK